MLPKVRSDGRPFILAWVYMVAGLIVILFAFARSGNIYLADLAAGFFMLLMALGIDMAVIRSRVERLEGEDEALRRLLDIRDQGKGQRE